MTSKLSSPISSIWETLSLTKHSPAWMGIVLAAVVLLPIAQFIARRKRLNLPVVDVSSYKNCHDAIIAATLENPNTPFILPYDPPTVMLPMSTLEEVRNLPERQVSFNEAIKCMFAYKYTGIGSNDPALMKAIKVDLTRHIASILDDVQDEIRYSYDRELGSCAEWKTVTLYPTLTRIIALLSGRVFVGLPTSRDEEWLDATISYATDCAMTRRAIEKCPVWLQPFVVPFLPEIRRLKKNRIRGSEILQPILEKCMAEVGDDEKNKSDDHQGTFFSWVLREMKDPSLANPEDMFKYQMALAFASIDTTSQTTFHAILDMASRPQYIQPLRDEIDRVLHEDGHDNDDDGFPKLKKSSMPKLRKLDSFMKESQRFSPLGLINMIRVTTAPLTLSTGHTLPKGTRIAFPTYPVHMSSSTPTFDLAKNPSCTLPSDQFDGFRFANLRGMPGHENKHQFVTTSPESMNFGHGSHACPGRFFASNEIKVVLIELLRSWDFRLKGDSKGAGSERPNNFTYEMSVLPDTELEIEFRRRTV